MGLSSSKPISGGDTAAATTTTTPTPQVPLNTPSLIPVTHPHNTQIEYSSSVTASLAQPLQMVIPHPQTALTPQYTLSQYTPALKI